MKIAIDGRALMDIQPGGVTAYCQDLLKALVDIDQTNQYLLFYNTHRRASDYPDIVERFEEFNRRGVRIIRRKIPNKILNYFLLWPFNWPKMNKLLQTEVDVFLMPHGNFVATNREAKNILTIHDLSYLHYKEFFDWHKNIWHHFINTHQLVKKFDKIVAISESTKRDLINLLGVDADKISVIYSGVSPDYQSLDKEDSRLAEVKVKYQLPERFILFVGTIEPRKNLVGLIKAYDYLRQNYPELAEVKLVIAGGNGWKFKEVYRASKASPWQADIKFLGFVEASDKCPLYNLAEVFAFPSFYEGFGFPPLEAMACGTPVVASFASSIPEVVGEAGILVDPYDTAQISEALANVLLDKNLADNLSQAGLARAKNFNWQKTAQEYLEIFKKQAI